MSRLVYIKEINPNGWLHWSFKNSSSELRNFQSPISKHSTNEIESLLKQPGNFSEKAPRVRVDDTKFWREHLRLRNVELGLEKVPDPKRLLDKFVNDTQPLLQDRNHRGLQIVFRDWNRRFASIVNRERHQFNHWDDDATTEKLSYSTGIGWTSYMLEHCRLDGKCRFIDTGSLSTDFSLISMDLNLGISSTSNKFQPGERDFIKPDGLGVRRDGSFCILEVKGPQDDASMLKATLQAVCGGLAVHAKREMIARIARTKATKRIKIGNARIPRDIPSMGIYIMMSAYRTKGRCMFNSSQLPELKESALLILKAFKAFSDITYFCVDTNSIGDFSKLLPALVVNR